jgi:hypothetical protein
MYRMVLPTALVCVLVTLALAPPASGEDAGSFRETVEPLVEAYCLDCHGPGTQMAGLRLDTLAADFTKDKVLATWIRVHDRLVAGEMPPPKGPRPEPEELKPAVAWLRRNLHTASLERQRKQGRVVVRRLNGTEYENTIRDLLGTNVSLKDMLPDDNELAGFDNVGAVLDVSATHQLIYQEAAEKAIASVIPVHPPILFRDRRTGREMSEKGPNFRQTLTRSCKLDGDALVVYSKLPRYGLCASAHVPTTGRYRVQMKIGAVGAAGRPVPAAFLTVERSGNEDPVVRDMRDIPPGEPSIVEVEIDLLRTQAFVVNLLSIWDIRNFKKPIEEYTGPGLRLEWMTIEGPIDPFPPPSYDRLFAGVPLEARSVDRARTEGTRIPKIAANRTVQQWDSDPLVPASAHPKEDAARLIRDFLPRALRRPVPEELVRHVIGRVHAKLDEKYTFLEAMTYGYKAILASPHFLLMMAPGIPAATAAARPSTTRLDDHALAERLSYFLWSTLPDPELRALAAQGRLGAPDVLRAQVERMLGDERARRLTENFVGQWLDVRKIGATIPDPQLYADFDGVLLWAMPRETYAFFEEVLRNDRSLLEFIDSDWTMLNERLATHYGIPGVEGNHFRKVALAPGSHRGGVMTHASVLKVTADGTRTSPVLRGKWVLERIIGKPPAPPPPDIPAIEPDIRGATTIRKQLDQHRNTAACATCHNQIDPPGFALEEYDPIGGWRAFYRASARTRAGIVPLPNYSGRPIYRGPDVEKGGVTPDGRPFADVDEYKRLLLSDRDQLARSLTEKLLVYATGGDIEFADREVVDRIVSTLKADGYGFRTLVHEVVQSRLFLDK